MNDMPLLRCSKLSKFYKEGAIYTKVLRSVSFTLLYGETVAIVGSSGSGKSTLLHLLGGLDQPTGGEIVFEGRSLNKLSSTELAIIRNQRIGFIYQFHHLLTDFSALENVAIPLLICHTHKEKAKEIATQMLIKVGLKERIHHHSPVMLSGGERQRVAIARSLINNPALVIADEPTGNLDQHNANSIFNLLVNLNKSQGIAFLIVTHDTKLAKQLNRQLTIHDGVLTVETQ